MLICSNQNRRRRKNNNIQKEMKIRCFYNSQLASPFIFHLKIKEKTQTRIHRLKMPAYSRIERKNPSRNV